MWRWPRACPVAVAMNSMLMRLVVGAFFALGALVALGCSGQQKDAKSAEQANGPPLALVPLQGEDGIKLENAVAAMDRGDFTRAIRTLEELRSRHPENGVLLHELALAYRLAKKPSVAVAVLMPFRKRRSPVSAARSTSSVAATKRSPCYARGSLATQTPGSCTPTSERRSTIGARSKRP